MSEETMDQVNSWLPLVTVVSFVAGVLALVLGMIGLYFQATAAVGELREMKTNTVTLGTKIDGLGTKIDGLGTKIDDFKDIVLREFDRNKP